jgi:hypothetical protein
MYFVDFAAFPRQSIATGEWHCSAFCAPARLILEFERNVELGTVGFDLALGIQL